MRPTDLHRLRRARARAVSVALASLALAGSLACLSTVEPVNVQVVTRVCDASRPELDPLAGPTPQAKPTSLRFTVYGPGITPLSLQTTAKLSQQTSQVLPDIPAGTDRDIVVEALDAAGDTISRGETGPLDLSQTTAPLNVVVFLRRLGTFTPLATAQAPLATAQAPTTCAQLGTTRAAATATTMGDGRVLIAGGFNGDNAGTNFLSSTEIYDPKTGVLKAGPDMTVPRAFHVAVHVPGTKLTLIAGGENSAMNTGSALNVAELFDEAHDVFLPIVQMQEARTRLAAAAPLDGSAVILAGGHGLNGEVLSSAEAFDPQKRQFVEMDPLSAPRVELTAVGLTKGRVLFLGGWNGTQLLTTTDLYAERPGTATFDWVKTSDWSLALPEGLAYPMAAPLGDSLVVVAGGFTGQDQPAEPLDQLLAGASPSTFVIDLDHKSATQGPALLDRRGEGGIAALEDGTVLVAGGASKASSDALSTASASADLLSPPSASEQAPLDVSSTGSMKDGRFLGAYTVLQDGTVFACGGLSYDSQGQPVFLRSVELYQPAYKLSATSAYH